MEIRSIVGLVIMGILFVLVLFLLNREDLRKKSKFDAANLSFDALLIALIAILGFVPYVGYITVLPGLSLTLVHLPVLLGAIVGGRKKGLLLGTAFGLTSMIQAISNPVGFNAMFVFPYISIPPRMLFGYLSGLVFEIIGRKGSLLKNSLKGGIACFFLTVLHTCLVFGFLFAFAYDDLSPFLSFQSEITTGVAIAFMGIIGLGMLGEATLSAIVVPLLNGIIQKAVPSFYRKVSFVQQ